MHPDGFNSSLPEVTNFSKRIHAKGLKVWLDLHYSDTWADPAAWGNLALFDFQNKALPALSVYHP